MNQGRDGLRSDPWHTHTKPCVIVCFSNHSTERAKTGDSVRLVGWPPWPLWQAPDSMRDLVSKSKVEIDRWRLAEIIGRI